MAEFHYIDQYDPKRRLWIEYDYEPGYQATRYDPAVASQITVVNIETESGKDVAVSDGELADIKKACWKDHEVYSQ